MASWAENKRRMRKAVHSAFRLSAVLVVGDNDPVEIGVRYHNKIALMGDIMESGYSEIIDGVDRLIFDREELREKGITLYRGNIIKLVDAEMKPITLSLEAEEPYNGPIDSKWMVKRL
ncbi:hypothetical protein CPT_Saba_060 [Proteus phage Saba]|uniref:Uncharacterized protein n=1 Tax=Proteus phage Saba TaxID=2596672 RepID=A0A5B9NF42_9CAUD|nr:hypothetical protein JT320_gp60 [Proteus phage Saba]QEG09433.1 hypothetical protein CPT_Saba_060 [Proteus phage Saba]